jgi:hypothetical protein
MTSLLFSRTFMSEDISGVELGTTVNQTNVMITMNDKNDNSRLDKFLSLHCYI